LTPAPKAENVEGSEVAAPPAGDEGRVCEAGLSAEAVLSAAGELKLGADEAADMGRLRAGVVKDGRRAKSKVRRRMQDDYLIWDGSCCCMVVGKRGDVDGEQASEGLEGDGARSMPAPFLCSDIVGRWRGWHAYWYSSSPCRYLSCQKEVSYNGIGERSGLEPGRVAGEERGPADVAEVEVELDDAFETTAKQGLSTMARSARRWESETHPKPAPACGGQPQRKAST
jgi:hypothetical protein